MSAVRDMALEGYFDAMKDLWEHPSFQTLLTEFTEQVESINSVETTRSNDDLLFRKGQLNIIRSLQNLSDNIAILEEDYLKEVEPQPTESDDVYL